MQNNSFEIYNETKWPHDVWPFLAIKNKILGSKFQISLNILRGKNSQKINIAQRNKDYIPNTLSFKYTKKSGEIILTPEIIKKECTSFDHTFDEHALFLYIHSLLHIKGFLHGKKMEQAENKFFKLFNKKSRKA